MRKLFVDASAVGASNIKLTDEGDIRHLTRVLRLREGDKITVSDSSGFEYECELLGPDEAREAAACESAGKYEKQGRGKALYLKILDKQALSMEPESDISLFQAVPKADKMDSVVRRCTELGIKRIVPVFSSRVVVEDKGGGRFAKKLDRWRRIASEASKQCGRSIVPEVSEPMDFKALLAELSRGAEEGKNGLYELAVLAYENEEKTTLKDVLRADPSLACGAEAARIALIIGPEGGFSEAEAEALLSAGAKAASLGRTILRTENAGPSALAMMLYELEL